MKTNPTGKGLKHPKPLQKRLTQPKKRQTTRKTLTEPGRKFYSIENRNVNEKKIRKKLTKMLKTPQNALKQP